MSVGIECGATHSSVLFVAPKDGSLRFRMGPANFKLMSNLELEGFLRGVKAKLGNVTVTEVGIGMPGIMDESDRAVVKGILRKVWTDSISVWVGSDLETAMACIPDESGLKVVVIAGTGSNCCGNDGKMESKIGGFGHVLGDRGSSYAIGLHGMRLSLREHEHAYSSNERNPRNGSLLDSIIKFLKLTSIPDLVNWSVKASKPEIANIAQVIIDSFRKGNSVAKKALTFSLTELAEDCICLINKFQLPSNESIQIGLTGSVFTKNEDIVQMFTFFVNQEMEDKANVVSTIKFTLLHDTVIGALRKVTNNNPPAIVRNKDLDEYDAVVMKESELAEKILPVYLRLPQTECRNPKSMNLDTMSLEDGIELMISEESQIYKEIERKKPEIKVLIERVSESLKRGGRLFYVGAGTSGRLGILDATECPPTFRTQPEMIQGIIAGGFSSVSKAKEGAEDSIIDGMNAIKERFVCDKDVVVGIAASGRTPFVWGSLYQAQQFGAFTTFLTFNVNLDMKIRPNLVIAMDLGPEVLTGSTRLKSGSATKCVLNTLSTLAMVKMGKCFENLMVDLNPANQKLKQRALRIVLLMTHNLESVNQDTALPVLQKNGYDIKSTVLELRQMYG